MRGRYRVAFWSPWQPQKFRRYLTYTGVVLLAAVLGGLPVYVYPKVDQLQHSDAVLVLGGYGQDRYKYGLWLAEHGWAPNVVWSIYNPKNASSITDACENVLRRPVTISCFTADPLTTLGEARELRQIAKERGWRKVIVVTARSHISRARYILAKCFDGQLIMRPNPEPISVVRWAYEYVYQTAGYLRAVAQSGC